MRLALSAIACLLQAGLVLVVSAAPPIALSLHHRSATIIYIHFPENLKRAEHAPVASNAEIKLSSQLVRDCAWTLIQYARTDLGLSSWNIELKIDTVLPGIDPKDFEFDFEGPPKCSSGSLMKTGHCTAKVELHNNSVNGTVTSANGVQHRYPLDLIVS
ncbi:hypothetical protein J3R30DRAFT_679228 [Lentinula aciculospora]|uniref:Uncharacterized protein n=1 Tax=Lentinula aciculospora TaxID=153920 RepID=A0A9W9A5L1_9AGAR|nr:hypothetical protein J3R30DRAFT_679228 [Lentinula aciculospora]